MERLCQMVRLIKEDCYLYILYKNRCQNSGPLFCYILNIVKMHEWMLFICSKKCIYLKSETNIDEKSHKSC